MGFTKKQWSWLLYDPANAAFALIARTVFFPVFFMAVAKPVWGEAVGTAYLSCTASAAGVAAGIFTLSFGNFADVRRKKRLMLAFCTGLSIAATAVLPFLGRTIRPGIVLGLFFCGMFGYMSANGFYDALLVDAAAPEERNRLSSVGYAWGYIGGMIPFIPVMLIAFFLKEWTFKAAFWLTALWWGVGTIPVLKNVEEKPNDGVRVPLLGTLKFIVSQPLILGFLITYFLYIDGVGTILLVATPLAKILKITDAVLMSIILALQLIAVPFTILYGKLAEKFGARPLIRIAIAVYVLIAVLTTILSLIPDLLTRQILFGAIAFLVGTSQGGIQALSRSLFSRIIPQERSAELFSVYNFFGKFTTILGPVLVWIATMCWGRPELGVTLLIVPFVCGWVSLRLLKLPAGVK